MSESKLKQIYERWERKNQEPEPELETLCDVFPDVPLFHLRDNECQEEVLDVRLQ